MHGKVIPTIILVGFMGSGKTSVGKRLAKMLGFDFFDLDQWIENENKARVGKIFKTKGVAFFREEETKAIRKIVRKKKAVISLGGGAWLSPINRNLMLKRGLCVLLEVSAKESWKRVRGDLKKRPLLFGKKKPFMELKNILKERAALYQLAHLKVPTDGRKPNEIAREISEIIEKRLGVPRKIRAGARKF